MDFFLVVVFRLLIGAALFCSSPSTCSGCGTGSGEARRKTEGDGIVIVSAMLCAVISKGLIEEEAIGHAMRRGGLFFS